MYVCIYDVYTLECTLQCKDRIVVFHFQSFCSIKQASVQFPTVFFKLDTEEVRNWGDQAKLTVVQNKSVEVNGFLHMQEEHGLY